MSIYILVIVLGMFAAVARRPLADGNLFLRRTLGRERDLDQDDAASAAIAIGVTGLVIACVAFVTLLVKVL